MLDTPIRYMSWEVRYIYSFYWSVTTMCTVGYGDISPTNQYEALFASINMILISCVFAYSINNIGMILQEIEKTSKELKDNQNTIQNYLERKKVNNEIKSRVRHYLQFLAEEQKNRNKKSEDEILQKLSNGLRDEITMEINCKIINSYQIFARNFSIKTINRLVFAMKEVLTLPNEVILRENEVDDMSIYFIYDGIIEIYYQNQINDKKEIIIKKLQSNNFFGELSFFSGLSRKASARSVNLSTLYKIERKEFLDILNQNQEDFQRLKMIQEQIIFQQDYSFITTDCYVCGKLNHLAFQCPNVHQLFDDQFLILREKFSIFQQRKIKQRQTKNKQCAMQNNINIQLFFYKKKKKKSKIKYQYFYIINFFYKKKCKNKILVFLFLYEKNINQYQYLIKMQNNINIKFVFFYIKNLKQNINIQLKYKIILIFNSLFYIKKILNNINIQLFFLYKKNTNQYQYLIKCKIILSFYQNINNINIQFLFFIQKNIKQQQYLIKMQKCKIILILNYLLIQKFQNKILISNQNVNNINIQFLFFYIKNLKQNINIQLKCKIILIFNFFFYIKKMLNNINNQLKCKIKLIIFKQNVKMQNNINIKFLFFLKKNNVKQYQYLIIFYIKKNVYQYQFFFFYKKQNISIQLFFIYKKKNISFQKQINLIKTIIQSFLRRRQLFHFF
ncbi:hypothetical protein IMG5_110890 [Ichthyophthirius multifiliis]|uniref:Cyclic nucleotide-binding domain-containing protein n=1 Tax=Ichthyophthirius multifiliis TaxID=5932 RepID=G0QTR3_ICHMU|nr:hypothetical protein IMG5_110890 [Ichthyophthirius multifiliis]EGR31384.1 hypothetical protein IMG5_110890 [Ichthyophthirius multifiliis]|eukprot:XP_004034870.1 hypothetical protein IMG5_110890 [Ichthyophthirius multifiliis]